MKALALLLGLWWLAGCAGTKTPVTPTLDDSVRSVERGGALFRNKGCVSCHVHDRVAGESGVVLDYIGAPDLTNYANDPAFLRRWLADPTRVRPAAKMPNLQLSTTEIDDLVAFLNEPR